MNQTTFPSIHNYYAFQKAYQHQYMYQKAKRNDIKMQIQDGIQYQPSFAKHEPLSSHSRESPDSAARSKRNIQTAIDQINLVHLSSPLQQSKKRKKDPERDEKQNLQKLYLPFSTNLKFEDLKRIHAIVSKYTNEEKGDKHGLELLRFLGRKQLVKIFSIAIAEIKSSGCEAVNVIETHIMNEALDHYGFISVLSCNLESHLFKHLFVDNVKSREQPYQLKMKCLKNQLNDKLNFSLRRGILNRTISFEFLEGATEEQLKSQERKCEEKQLIKRLVRQSQIWIDEKQIKKEKEEERMTSQMPTNVPDDDNDDEEPIEVVEMSSEKKVLWESYQKVMSTYESCKQEMKRRIEAIECQSKERLLADYLLNFQKK